MQSPRQQRSLREYIGIVLSGFAMGVCEIIPGVSGGTMAFILGIYEELIGSIRDVSKPEFIQAVLKFRIKEIFTLLNWQFLVALAIGMFTAILSLAGILEYLLETRPALVWSFFFGLVVASIVLVMRRIERWDAAAYRTLCCRHSGRLRLSRPCASPDADGVVVSNLLRRNRHLRHDFARRERCVYLGDFGQVRLRARGGQRF